MVQRLRSRGRPTYGGIDPGRDGFMILIDGRKIILAERIPYLANGIDRVRLLEILFAWRLEYNCVFVNLEFQQFFPRDGGRAAFSMGHAFGVLEACLTAADIPYETPKPNQWKRDAGIPIAQKGKLPRLPKKPKKLKGAALTRWKVDYAETERKRNAIQRARKTRTKDLACTRAQSLMPRYDFRVSLRAKKPHSGKCEAFLLAVLAFRIHRRR